MNTKLLLRTLNLLFIIAFSAQSINAQFCSGPDTLGTVNGTFTDGSGTANYQNNANCTWLIQPKNNPVNITLIMDSLNLSGFTDAVRVYDGTSTAGTLIANYRGNNLGNPAIANSGSMFVQFTSNGFGTAQGWKASYTSSINNCQPNTVITANTGDFTDGTRNGSDYLNNTDCEWLIQPTTAGVLVEVNFSRFALANGDSLILYDGVDASAPIISTLVANTTVGTYRSTSGSLFVRFISDTTNVANGWRIVYTSPPIPTCSGNTNLLSPTGIFSDGSLTLSNYSNNNNCSWLIQPPGAISVDLSFNYFSTESQFDFVNVYQGTNNNGLLLGSFSGPNIPSTVTSTTGTMFVEFTSDQAVNSTGWEGSYTSSNFASISAAIDTIYINAGAGSTESFQLTANSNWTTSDNQAWLISTPINGTGNQTINLLALQGNIGPERSAQLYINASNGSGGDTVTVIQRSSGRFLDINTDTLFFSASNPSSQNFQLLANVPWVLAASQSWITLNSNNGSNNSNLQVSVMNNTSSQIRSGFIVAAGSQNAGNDTIYVVQDSLTQNFSTTPDSIRLTATVGSTNIIQVNSTVAWNLTNSPSWVSASLTSGTDSLQITITTSSTNIGQTVRSGYIYFSTTNGNFSDSVHVTQEFFPQTFTVTPNNIQLSSQVNSTGITTVNANIPWTLTHTATWFSTSVSSGNDTTVITITANSSPPSVNSRSATIYFSAGNSQFQDSVEVTQQGISAFLTGSPDTLYIGMGSGEFATFNVAASGGWTPSTPVNWLSLQAMPGSVNGFLIATSTSVNQSPNPRMATIYLNDPVSLISDTVVVVQGTASGTIFVNPTNINLASNSGSSASFNITSDVNWNITGLPNWASASSLSGMNNGSVTISSSSANNSGSSRTADITISALGAISKKVTITQLDANNTSFLLSVDTLYIGSASASVSDFTVISNSNWSLTESSSWLALNKLSGNGTDIVTARTSSDNLFGSPRFAVVSASSPGNPNRTLIVAQLGSTLSFSYAPDSLMLGADSASFGKFNISSNLISWSASTNVNWLNVTPTSGSLTSEILVTATKPNNTGQQRSSIVTISSPPFIPLRAKVTQDTIRSIGINEESISAKIQLYPNPSVGEIHLKFDPILDIDNTFIEIRDMLGKPVQYDLNVISREHLVFDFSELNNGIYFVQIQVENRRITKKVLLLK